MFGGVDRAGLVLTGFHLSLDKSPSISSLDSAAVALEALSRYRLRSAAALPFDLRESSVGRYQLETKCLIPSRPPPWQTPGAKALRQRVSHPDLVSHRWHKPCKATATRLAGSRSQSASALHSPCPSLAALPSAAPAPEGYTRAGGFTAARVPFVRSAESAVVSRLAAIIPLLPSHYPARAAIRKTP